jgi:hypothetical protein
MKNCIAKSTKVEFYYHYLFIYYHYYLYLVTLELMMVNKLQQLFSSEWHDNYCEGKRTEEYGLFQSTILVFTLWKEWKMEDTNQDS